MRGENFGDAKGGGALGTLLGQSIDTGVLKSDVHARQDGMLLTAVSVILSINGFPRSGNLLANPCDLTDLLFDGVSPLPPAYRCTRTQLPGW